MRCEAPEISCPRWSRRGWRLVRARTAQPSPQRGRQERMFLMSALMMRAPRCRRRLMKSCRVHVTAKFHACGVFAFWQGERNCLGLRRLGRSRRVTPGSADKSGHAREKQRVLSMAKGRSRAASSRLGALEYMMVAQLTPPFEPAKAVRLSWRAQRRPSAAGAAASAAPDPLLPPSGRFYHSTRCCSSGLHCRAVTVTRPLRRRRRWQRWRRR